MQIKLLRLKSSFAFLLSALVPAAACSSDSDTPGTGNSSGGANTGGLSTGGSSSGGVRTGGAPATGGVIATGGSVAMTGGSGGKATGGQPATGGTTATGGSAAGGSSGASGSGGNSASSGSSGDGGKSAGGAGLGGSGTAGGGAGGGTAGGSGGGTAGGSGGGGSGEAKSAGCGKTRTLMNGRRTIQSGGNREYILRVPDNYDNNRPYRLIIAYHWLNGNANNVANGGGSTEQPYYGLWNLAENSTIFVAPEGLDAGWANTGNRDLNLTDAILEQVQNDLCIDKTRIFATGFSYGGGMSYAIACARANVFRGVAVYAGSQLSGCMGGTTPIAYFAVHGVADGVLNVSQGRSLRDKFVMVNGCMAQNPPEPARGSGTHTCTSYQGCKAGFPVRWCAHGGDHNPTEKDQGQNQSWVPGEAWDFIKQF